MWRHTRMIVLTVLVAAVYAAVLIPFKAIPIVPGITELRIAQVLPPVASLLFGPAAAWGIAIGNLIGDLFGTFGPGSAFGFLGNFFLGAMPYMLWGRLGPLSAHQEPAMANRRQVLEFIIVTAVSGIACAFAIAWGLELLGLFPFTVLGLLIAMNNVILPGAVGWIVLRLLYRRVKRWGLIWTELMEPEEVGNQPTASVAAWLCAVATLAGWALCLALSVGAGGKFGDAGLQAGTGGAMNVVLAGAPFLAAILLSFVLGSPRTDLGQQGGERAA